MANPPPPAVTLMYCYAPQDKNLRDELDKHLALLRRSNRMIDWYDGNISPGMERDKEIKQHLRTAQIILLLISPDFIASNYYYDKEMMVAIRRHNAGKARVIPVILRYAHWEGAPFSRLQMLPEDARPIKDRPDRERTLAEIAGKIDRVVSEICITNLLEHGENLLEKQSYDQATTALNQALGQLQRAGDYIQEAVVYNGRALVGLCRAAYATGRYKDALTSSERAIKLNPNLSMAYSYKGAALNELLRYQEALVACERAIQLDQQSGDAYTEKGTALG